MKYTRHHDICEQGHYMPVGGAGGTPGAPEPRKARRGESAITVVIIFPTPQVKDGCAQWVNVLVTTIHLGREENRGPQNKKVRRSYNRDRKRAESPLKKDRKGGILGGDLLHLAGDIETNPGPDRETREGGRNINVMKAPEEQWEREQANRAGNHKSEKSTKGAEEIWGQEGSMLGEAQYPGFEDDDPELTRDREPFDPSRGGGEMG